MKYLAEMLPGTQGWGETVMQNQLSHPVTAIVHVPWKGAHCQVHKTHISRVGANWLPENPANKHKNSL